MKRISLALLDPSSPLWRGSAAAHHSFAIYDMQQNVEFHGVVANIKLRNPHMAMTLTTTDADGKQQTIEFVEGAPANMLARLGLTARPRQGGTRAHGHRRTAPRQSDAWFLKAIILPDGTRFNALQSPNQQR